MLTHTNFILSKTKVPELIISHPSTR